MRAVPLQLSHWDDDAVVCVPAGVAMDLKNYHLHGVRFLYSCYRKKFKGTILNHEPGMNFPQQVTAFFSALHEFVTRPVLVVCSGKTLRTWHYHFTKGGYNVTVLSLKNCEEAEEREVVLAVIDDVKLLQKVKGVSFFAVVVEELDKVVTKLVIRQLKGEFNVGLTTMDFMQNRDLKLMWNIMKWTGHSIKKFDQFSEEDADDLKNEKNPYPEWWQRLAWNFCETFKGSTEEEQQDYETEIAQWARQQGLVKNLPEPNPPQKCKASRTTGPKKLKIEKKPDDESWENCENETTQPSTSKTRRTQNPRTSSARASESAIKEKKFLTSTHKPKTTRAARSKLLEMLSESSDGEESDIITTETDIITANNDARKSRKPPASSRTKRKTTRTTRSKMLNMLSDSSEEENNVGGEKYINETDYTKGNNDTNSESKLRQPSLSSKMKQTKKRKSRSKRLHILNESSDDESHPEKEEIKGDNGTKTEEFDKKNSTLNDSVSSDDTIIYDFKTSPPTEEINTNLNLDSSRAASMLFDLNTNSTPTLSTGSFQEQSNSLDSENGSRRNEILSLLYGDQ